MPSRASAGGRVARGLILFGHGSREPRWAEPFERLAAEVRSQTSCEVRLAYLEVMQPDLEGAAESLIASGATSIRIVPIFFGQGGHITRDLASWLDRLRERHPGVAFESTAAIGDDAAVIEALAAYCLRSLSA